MKLFKRILTAMAVMALVIWQFPDGSNNTARAGTISSITAVGSSAVKSATSNYTFTFTPATALANFGQVGISFQGPPDAQFGVSGATLGTGSSAIFTEIGNIESQYSTVNVNASSLTAGTEYTLILNGLNNPSKDGKYNVNIQTWGQNGQADSGLTSITVGTIGMQGVVYLSDGITPAIDAYVNAEDTSNFSNRFGSNTATDGSYGIGGLTSGVSYRVNVFLNPSPNSNTAGYITPDIANITYSGTTITQNITLDRATKSISGKLMYPNGTGIANGRVMANRMDGPGWVNVETNSAGNYTMLMSGGKWEVRADTWAGPGQIAPDYTFSGQGPQVKFSKDSNIETKTNVDLKVIVANATITGSVTPIPTGMGGIGLHNRTGFGTGTGLDPSTGAFSMKVPAGTYELDMFSDPSQSGDRYLLPSMGSITVGDNETKALGQITLVKMDKTITATVKDSTGSGLSGFMVGCFQPRGSAFTMGMTDANGSTSISAIAGEWGCMAMSGMGGKGGEGEGGPGGPMGALYKLNEIKNQFYEKAYAQEGSERTESNYVTLGGPQFITVTADNSPTINFTALLADKTINVTITDTLGNELQEYGFIEAELVSSALGSEFGKGGLGAPIDPNQPGMASINVPAGIYDLRMMTPPGSDYSSGDTTRVDVTNGDANAQIKLLLNDSTVSGNLLDEDGAQVTGVFAFVTATNPKGAFIPGDVDSAAGTYSMRVPSAGGALNLGYFVDPDSGYFPQPFTDASVTPVAGATQVKDIIMKKATVTANVTVKDPSGNTVANAFVEVDTRNSDRNVKMDHFFNHGDKTDSNGQVTLRLPAGDYALQAFLPPETLRTNKWLPPKSGRQTFVKDQTYNITLTFQAADVKLSGKVTNSSGTAIGSAFVTAYSSEGESIEVNTDASGDYSIDVIGGEWHIVAEKDDTSSGDDQPVPLVSVDQAINTGSSKTVTQNISVSAGTALSSPVTSTFDSDNSKVVRLTDGTIAGANVAIPQDALDADSQGDNVTVNAQSTVELPHQLLDKPLGAGFEITAQNSSGQPVTSLNSSVSITIPVVKTLLTNAGLAVTDIGTKATMSYYDEENGKWAPLDGSITYIEDGDNVLVTGQSSHFTTFAVTAATDTTPPAAPASQSATDLKTGGKVKVSWTNPTDSDLASIKVYRSTTEGTVGSAIKTITSTTTTSYEDSGLTDGTKYYYVVKALDSSNNESSNTTQVNATPSTASLPSTGLPNLSSIITNLLVKIANAIN
ncbi:MAG: Fibronectin type III domain protein [Berkelbacteria bacterium GW2011_GWA2_35_9]|uniref:Fibronectin type III domain protein n=1 Tax=Berkelbacteria bacterium GW2011_GWA2_35_9 TaxID=1618333 RepID=A0A0G0FLU4_9BACT|nr:MAG: Fibronectin type III domain protein [Berkelbacteria bacterium GW2011_GWA2_35_9]